MKYAKMLILTAFAAILVLGSLEMPNRGNPDSLMNREKSVTGSEVAGNYYIQEAYNDANTPNMVTVILGDYRSIDTLGEQIVVFTAGLICLLILRRDRPE